MESTDLAMSSAERCVVPLNTMCSMKCEIPFSSPFSQRDPVPIQMPSETDRTWSIFSVMTRTPFASVVLSIPGILSGAISMMVATALILSRFYKGHR